MNPLNWSGPAFLALYIPLFGLSLLAGIALRWWLKHPGAPPGMPPPSVSPYEAALLRGPQSLIEAAMASLFHQGLIRTESGRLVTADKIPFSAPLIERIVHAAVETGELHRRSVLDRARPAIRQLQGPLVARGWLLDEARSQQARWLPLLPALAVQLLGMAKLLVGMSRDRPVGWLLLLSFFWGVMVLGFLIMAPQRTRLGDTVFNLIRMEHGLSRLSATGPLSASPLSSGHVALVAGLFGLTAVGFDEFEDLRRLTESHGFSRGPPGSGSGDSGSGDSGGGDSGGDGGGGGCGGCGGGGCS
ncbi:MAG TPA: TIGR04222 domain-containing membrane protein [Myxococcus sp.]|nr:TIGR04222 domain-containing membrane protein [Myxococcus sp.]